MINDIYSRGEAENKFNSTVVEVTDDISQLILKIENALFTRKGEVLGVPDFGCNLDDLIFSLVLNESVIQERINSQIQAYCLLDYDTRFNIDTQVSFFQTEGRNGALVDIYINETRVIGALF
jgi:phage baseplate assembly protein W